MNSESGSTDQAQGVAPRPGRKAVYLVFAVLAIVAMVTIVPKAMSWNDSSRMATIQALVERGSLAIGSTDFTTEDKVFLNGTFYSDKPITPQLFGALVYLPLSALGVKLHPGWNLAYYLITLMTMKLLWLLSLVAFFRTLSFTTLSQARRLWLTVALGVGTLALTWSATFSNHSWAASWVTIGFSFFVKARRGSRPAPSLLLAGLSLGLAGSSDVPTLIIPAVFGCYVLLDSRLRRGLLAYVAALAVAIAPWLVVNFAISGSLVPVQLVAENFLWPGSPWTPDMLSGGQLNTPEFVATYLPGLLVGSRGFLFYNPFAWIAIPLMVAEFIRRRKFAPEALAATAATVVIIGYYALWSNNYSGASYSIRWFVPLLPLWMFFVHPLLEGRGRWRWLLFFALLAMAVPIAVIGAWDPWPLRRYGDVPLLANLKMTPIHAASLWEAIRQQFP
ncbi:MAG TPA: hypothetical protein VGK18_16490 [Propionicimonas sp.]|uniref:hypothetical protein n=1 Tax=Propionicimonas sp. TaxID=1955623 RepID=UPI002F403810